MIKQLRSGLLMALSLSVLAACSSAPYTPVANQAEPVDMTAFTPKVDSFVVLLDTSGSMKEDPQGRPKINNAQDLVASFNSAVPPLDIKAAMVTFGKGTDSCWGFGAVSNIYGPTMYKSSDFADALGSIECAASTTPIAEAVANTTELLVKEKGRIAVIIVSDFKWGDPDAVKTAVADLKSQHGDKLCLHTVKIGDETSNDPLIADVTGATDCGSAVSAQSIASATAMTAYVADTLMSPLPKMQYEKHTMSATTLFDFNKTLLKEQGKAELQQLGASIRSQGISVGDIDVVGHTDSIGSASYNQRLSMRRAMAVKYYLVKQGINAGIIDVSGMGKTEPVASNDTDEGRALNRRVEIHVGTTQLSE